MQKSRIMNKLIRFVKSDLNAKTILRCLTRNWHLKVTAINESQNLNILDLSTIFEKLKEREQEPIILPNMKIL